MLRTSVLLLAICSTTASACASDTTPDGEVDMVVPNTNLSSGASCPDDSTLSYESFGKGFFQSYCVRCHSAAVSGMERTTPEGSNFDDLTVIRERVMYIDQFAAAGPKGEHMVMPPDGEKPTLEQRTQLGEWLACGAPR